MRNSRALAVTLAAGAFIGLAAPAASAWDASTISVSPSYVSRGGTATVTVSASECRTGGHVSSSAFPNTPVSWNGGAATAHVTVHHDAYVGSHDVSVTCGGSTITKPAGITVIHGGVRGGLGGSTTTGATSTDMAIGGALVAAAVIGGGVFWLRRRGEAKA
ncbi:hypothetical protein P8605_25160 [Streptomyces sp. T-3]|nr:hypothetical protein [Streptomyces sp. T-3]